MTTPVAGRPETQTEFVFNKYVFPNVFRVSMRYRADCRASLVVILLLIARANLSGCSCARIAPACDAAWKADAVFVGTVAHVEPLTIFGIPLAWPFPTERRVTFAVKELFRGTSGKTIEVGTTMGCCACGIDFQRGRDYLVYAYRSAGTRSLYTGICTRTSYVENAANDLAYLRSLGTPSAPSARVYGFITADGWDIRVGEKATQPLAAVPVSLRSDVREWQTITDGSGAYDFPSLPGGRFLLSAHLPRQLGGGKTREISLTQHGCSQQILFAVEQGELSGRVLDSSGRPVQTNVVLVPVTNSQRGKADEGYSTADGTFTVRNVGPGDYFLGVNLSEPPRERSGLSAPWQPTYYPGAQDRKLATQIHFDSAQRLQGFEFRLPPPLKQRMITGLVAWANGQPAMAFVELKDNEFEGNVDLGNSGRDGRFTVTGVFDRPYSISAVVGIGDGETPMHSPKINLGLSMSGPVRLVLSLPGRK